MRAVLLAWWVSVLASGSRLPRTVQVEWRQGDQSLEADLFDLSGGSPAPLLGTLSLQVGKFPCRLEWFCGAETWYSMGEVSPWDQPS